MEPDINYVIDPQFDLYYLSVLDQDNVWVFSLLDIDVIDINKTKMFDDLVDLI